MSFNKIFTNPEAHPLILYLACEKILDSEWKTWITETVVSEIKSHTGADINPNNLNKLMAAKTLYISDTFWYIS